MKLTENQTTYIENYIKRFDIKYYEVYMEILDHMILSVEAILEKDKEISFEDAVVQAKKQFGLNGFKKFSEQKLDLFRKQNRIKYGNELKKFFTFPTILLTLTGIICYAFFLGIFEQPKKVTIRLILVFFLISLFQLKFWYQNRKIETFKIIKNEIYSYGINSVAMWLYFHGMISNEANSIYAIILFSLMTTMSILSLLIFIKIRKKINSEIETYKLV